MSVLASPSDSDYIRQITAHLKSTGNIRFAEVFLVLDTMEQDEALPLLAVAQAMRQANEIDRFVQLDRHLDIATARKHFCEIPTSLRDRRALPLFGWITGIESATADYLFHADSDVLIHAKPDFSWVEQAIALMDDDASALFVAPLPGPPNPQGLLDQHPAPIVDADGNYRFKSFSSRRYVVHRKRFEQLLPLKPVHVERPAKGPSSLATWEKHVSFALQSSPFYRVHLKDPRAWALHCPNHGAVWRENLPNLIAAVEDGDFPASQAGRYDLVLEAWLERSFAARKAQANKITKVPPQATTATGRS